MNSPRLFFPILALLVTAGFPHSALPNIQNHGTLVTNNIDQLIAESTIKIYASDDNARRAERAMDGYYLPSQKKLDFNKCMDAEVERLTKAIQRVEARGGRPEISGVADPQLMIMRFKCGQGVGVIPSHLSY